MGHTAGAVHRSPPRWERSVSMECVNMLLLWGRGDDQFRWNLLYILIYNATWLHSGQLCYNTL